MAVELIDLRLALDVRMNRHANAPHDLRKKIADFTWKELARGKTRGDIAKALDIPYSTLVRWLLQYPEGRVAKKKKTTTAASSKKKKNKKASSKTTKAKR